MPHVAHNAGMMRQVERYDLHNFSVRTLTYDLVYYCGEESETVHVYLRLFVPDV